MTSISSLPGFSSFPTAKLARALRNEDMYVHAWRKERRNLSARGSFSRKLGFSNSNLPEYSRPQTRDMSGLTFRKLKWKRSLPPPNLYYRNISSHCSPHLPPRLFKYLMEMLYLIFLPSGSLRMVFRRGRQVIRGQTLVRSSSLSVVDSSSIKRWVIIVPQRDVVKTTCIESS